MLCPNAQTAARNKSSLLPARRPEPAPAFSATARPHRRGLVERDHRLLELLLPETSGDRACGDEARKRQRDCPANGCGLLPVPLVGRCRALPGLESRVPAHGHSCGASDHLRMAREPATKIAEATNNQSSMVSI